MLHGVLITAAVFAKNFLSEVIFMVIDEVKDMLSKQLRIDIDEIHDDSNIMEDLGVDSIDLVELLMGIEEKLGIVVSDEDAANLKTVKDVADYIEQHS